MSTILLLIQKIHCKKETKHCIYSDHMVSCFAEHKKVKKGSDHMDSTAHINKMCIRDRPELMLFTIIELVGSTCYSCILYGQPVSVEEYLPYLHTVIRQILAGFLVQQPAQIETKTAS